MFMVENITPRDRYVRTTSYPGAQFIWFLLWVVNVILAFRFFLKLVGANPGAGFTNFIYTISEPLIRPFLNVIRGTAVDGGVFEWSTVLAMVVYWVLAWLVVMVLAVSRPVAVVHAREMDDDYVDDDDVVIRK